MKKHVFALVASGLLLASSATFAQSPGNIVQPDDSDLKIQSISYEPVAMRAAPGTQLGGPQPDGLLGGLSGTTIAVTTAIIGGAAAAASDSGGGGGGGSSTSTSTTP